VRLTIPEEIAGFWAAKFGEDVTVLHDFKANIENKERRN